MGKWGLKDIKWLVFKAGSGGSIAQGPRMWMSPKSTCGPVHLGGRALGSSVGGGHGSARSLSPRLVGKAGLEVQRYWYWVYS